MQTPQDISLDFYEAVIANNGIRVEKILNNTLSSSIKIPLKTITGMLVIAVEYKLIESIDAILKYNTYSFDKISYKHLDAILLLASKLDLLKDLKISYH